MAGHRLIQTVIICIAGLFVACDCCAEATSHKLNASDPMPEFSVVDSQGAAFNYARIDQSILLVVFFSPQKSQSMKAMADIENVLASIDKMPHKLSFLAVSDDPNSANTIKIEDTDQLTMHFVRDTDFKLWGKFGVIASPTVFLAGIDGKIKFIRAGYGYDFAPVIKSKLQVIMGLISEKDVNDVSQVKTVINTSAEEKANRHLKMAQMLEGRGNYDGALSQLETAIQIDPNSMECTLELGRMYCVVSDPNEAVNAVMNLRPADKRHQALRAFVLGKAYSQLKDYSGAEKYLLEAVDLDPKNSQAFYELGKVFHSQNQNEKAIELYRKSLDLIYGTKK
ncbi:MAG: tetratricopeptide repeat protein [Planctomycetes bacterium]|nr:tetratricopeptide repeat protein [Planctomycetota bacterium]